MELLRINLATQTVESDDAPFVSGVMTLPEETWGDLTDRGYPGIGYWPVIDHTPSFDSATQRLGDVTLIVGEGQVIRSNAVVSLTSDEIAARNAAARDIVWEAIKAFRDNRLLNGGYPAGGHWYYSDLIARSQHLANARAADLIQAAGGDMNATMIIEGTMPRVVKSMDNGYMAITANIAHGIMTGAEMHESRTYTAGIVHKAALEVSTSPATYDYSAGWPDVFEES